MLQGIGKQSKNKVAQFLLRNQKARIFLFQFIGTAFLVFIASAADKLPPFQDHPSDKNPFKLIYVAITLYTIICFIGPFTGAHVNPAVTLMAYLESKKRKGEKLTIVTYFLAEFLGGFVGAFLSKNINENGGAIFNQIPSFFQLLRLCCQELLATFVFLFFILLFTTPESTFLTDEAWIHLSIAIGFYLSLTLSSRLHLLNPAVVFGLESQALLQGGASSAGIVPCLFIVFSQFVGGGLADLAFRKLYMPAYTNWKQKLS